MQNKQKPATRNETVCGLTHLLGAALSLVGLAVLVYSASINNRPWHLVSFAIFGTALTLLYSASTFYHLLSVSTSVSTKVKDILRRIDHSMIFILIAGTYTPICLVPIRGIWGWSLLGFIWVIAIAGVTVKAFSIRIPDWLSTGIYVLMGWFGVVALWPLIDAVPLMGIVWLITGGIFYTVGVIFYSLERFVLPSRWFGMHEIFHLFVLAGSFSHFWLMVKYISLIG